VIGPIAGWAGDRLGRRKPLLIAATITGVAGMILIAVAPAVGPFLIGVTLVTGVSAGIMMGTYIAFAIAVMRDKLAAARNLGVINIALTLPFSIVPFIAPMLLGIGGGTTNYVALVVFGAVLMAAGAAPLLGIRSER
jgi:MFS family permease